MCFSEYKKTLVFLSGCLVLFLVSALTATIVPLPIPTIKTAETKPESEVYSNAVSEDVCFMLTFLKTEWKIIIDFDSSQTYAVLKTNEMYSVGEKYLDIPDSTLCGIIDRIGGVDLTVTVAIDGYDNLPRHYTGAQILKLFSLLPANEKESADLKNRLVCLIIEKIGSLGFSNDDFYYIINNSTTNISYVDYYGVSSHLEDALETCQYFE